MACRVAGVSLALVALVAVQTANGNERPASRQSTETPAWSWTGFYVGGHVGAGSGQANFSNPIQSSLYGDDVTTPAFLGGVQIGYNWQLTDRWVVGVEADASVLGARGNFTCLQASATVIGSTCTVKPHWMATATARAGRALGPDGRTLVYAKGGAAFLAGDVTLDPNSQFFGNLPQRAPESARVRSWGWTAGAGVEHALTPAWSVRLEYDYARFASDDVATPRTYNVTLGGTTTGIAANTSTMTQDFHILKAGLNYRFGMNPNARWDNMAASYAASKPMPAAVSGWEFEAGARYWYSTGRHQWASVLPAGDIAVSRLTYDKMAGPSGEVFARIDAPSNVFAKGFIGLGNISRGKMNDEDWGLLSGVNRVAYSNAELNPIQGPMVYGTADIGANVLRGADYRVGVFVGYNYFRETMNGYGCTQMANPGSGICSPALSPGLLVISQVATWQSLRVGFAADVKLGDRLKLSGDLAYLPYAKFDGIDYHWLRSLVGPQWAIGSGVQAELLVSYLLTDRFSVGLGGRYWAMWVPDGHLTAAQFNVNTERYGMFAQASYAFASGQ